MKKNHLIQSRLYANETKSSRLRTLLQQKKENLQSESYETQKKDNLLFKTGEVNTIHFFSIAELSNCV